MENAWRDIVAASLDWRQAHVSFDEVVVNWPVGLRGVRPDGYPHSGWELVEHIRLTQADLLDYMENAAYVPPPWPKAYWPATRAPATEAAWEETVAGVRRDREALQAVARRPTLDLTQKIPWAEGPHTYLRTILVAVDHAAYHVGQLVAVRRLLGIWPVP